VWVTGYVVPSTDAASTLSVAGQHSRH
jgi:hypothetical protein